MGAGELNGNEKRANGEDFGGDTGRGEGEVRALPSPMLDLASRAILNGENIGIKQRRVEARQGA